MNTSLIGVDDRRVSGRSMPPLRFRWQEEAVAASTRIARPATSEPRGDDLIVTHIDLVAPIVNHALRRMPAHVSRDDLQSAGLTALVKAARSFKPELGVPFNRYANLRIRGAILDELRRVDWASRSVRPIARSIADSRAAMQATLGHMPSDAEVAEDLGIAEAAITANDEDLWRANPVSIQGSQNGAVEHLLTSKEPEPEAVVEHKEKLTYLVEAIAELPERMRTVVTEYFLKERPMAEIAELLGVTESRISQIRSEALVLLRDALNFALDPDLREPAERPGGCVERRRNRYCQAVADRHAARQTPAT